MIAQLQKHVRLWFLTAIALLAAVPPAIARDFTYEYAGQTLTYTVLSEEDKTCETKQGTPRIELDGQSVPAHAGNDVRGAVVIPETISDGVNSYTVTTIGEYSFYDCYGLKSITIPSSVTSIGEYSFSRCFGLTSISIPNSVTTIGTMAFYDCSALTSIELPNSLTTIGEYSFYRCIGLTSIELPSSVTTIGAWAFAECSELTSIELPNSLTTIGESSFFTCSGLKSIAIPSSVTTIGAWAFFGCTALTSIEIPSSVTSIGGYVFKKCTAMTSVVYNSDAFGEGLFLDSPVSDLTIGGTTARGFDIHGLRRLTLTDNVTSIGWGAFSGFSGLTSLELPGSVTTIGESAFYGCSGLTSLEIPSSVTTIGGAAFYGCSGLSSIEIPNSVSAIGNYVFRNCDGLTSVIYNSDAFGELLFLDSPVSDLTIGGTTVPNHMVDYFGIIKESLKELTLTDKVTTIGDSAFVDCIGLTSVGIPSSVTTIGQSAFNGCSSLTSIEIPSSVTTIGQSAFEGCSGLSSIEIPSSVTTIGSSVFRYCDGLTSVVYNSDAYGNNLFDGCPISDLTIGGTIAYGFGIDGKGIEGLKRLTLTDKVTTIRERAFYGCSGLTSLEIPSSVTTIGNIAFSGCTGLTSVEIPDSVTTIGDGAFYGCHGLTSVELPNSLTTIGQSTFSGCSSLTSIEIPNSVSAIGGFAFSGCSELTSVVYNSDAFGEQLFQSSPVSDLTIGGNTVPNGMVFYFGIKESLKVLTLTDKITTIGERAFSGCSGLTSLEIPSSVTTIGQSAFEGCSGLTSIEIPNTVSAIGNYVFRNCDGLTSVVYNSDAFGDGLFQSSPVSDLTIGGTTVPNNMVGDWGIRESLKELMITGKVTTIGDYAFRDCTALTSLELPSSLTTIGDNAFYGCSGLTSVEIPGSVITIGTSAFRDCTALTSLELPSSLTTIGISAFSGCTGLTSVGLRSSVTAISDYAFYGCTALTSIELPDSLTTIGNKAFSGCTSLTSVGLRSSVTTIGNHAFYGCTALTSIEFPGSITTIGERAFYACSGLTSIEIPSSVTTIGSYAFCVCSNLTSVIYNSDAYAEGIFNSCYQVTDVTFGGTTIPNKVADTLFGSESYIKTRLKNITFTDNVSSIGEQAFEGCGNIETISFASVTPPEANQNEFSELWRSARIVVPGDALTTYLDSAPYNRFYKWGTVEEPEGYSDGVFAYVFTENPPAAYIMADESYREAGPALTVPLRTNKGTTIYPIKGILPGAFHYCTNLNSVKIGNNVELIGYNAFASCNALTSVEIPNSVITIGGGAFNGCSGLTSIEIPNSVTTIGDTAFSNCYGLTSLEIPNSVATIGYGAFMGNYKVSELTLSSGLKTIGVAAFQGCARITDVVIPPFVTEIGASAFAGTGLKTVKIGCRVTSIGANAFAQVNDMTGIYVTAMAPPTAENTSFSNYSMPLYVVPGTISLYENASPCWYRFYDEGSISEQTPVTEVTVEDMLLAGAKPGDTFQIKSGVVPAEATLPHLFYVSSNPDVVQVTHEGLVTIMEPQATNDEEIETYSYREPADVEIRVYSMYDDVAPAVIKFDISTGVDDIVIGDASGEIDRSLPYEVYNLNGQMVGTDRSNLANGIYIVRQGSKVQKIAVK